MNMPKFQSKHPPYGLLLALDGYGAPSEVCADPLVLSNFLERFPGEIGMRALGCPEIVHVDEPGVRGLSGFTFIIESHISVHTYEERGFISVDVYSCRSFDIEFATARIVDTFNLVSFETKVLTRGRHFNNPSFSKIPRPHLRP